MLEAQGRREFSGHAEQVAAARRFVGSVIQGDGPARDVSRLLVSEAATNALLHSASGEGGSFAVDGSPDGRTVWFELDLAAVEARSSR